MTLLCELQAGDSALAARVGFQLRQRDEALTVPAPDPATVGRDATLSADQQAVVHKGQGGRQADIDRHDMWIGTLTMSCREDGPLEIDGEAVPLLPRGM